MTPDEYECAECGGVFPKGRSDAEAADEAEDVWGERPDTHDMAMVCDDCYKAITAVVPPPRKGVTEES